MPIVNKSVLKGYYEKGDKPSQSQFATLIDSMVNIVEDRYLLGLREYDPQKQYLQGDTMLYNNALYKCVATTTGTFDPPSWQVIASLGSVIYSGTWDAINNVPTLASGVGVQGHYYAVSDASSIPSQNTMLDGIDDWVITDWAIFNGTIWQKVNASAVPIQASNVIFTPDGNIISTNVQDAIEEVSDDADIQIAAIKKLVLPITFGTTYPFTTGDNTNWGRVPLQITVPEVADIFPGATIVTAKILLDYTTASSALDCKMALINLTDYPGGTITNAMIMTGSDSTLTAITSYGTTTGPSFSITPGKSYSVLIQRTAGTVEVEGATLIISFATP